jgi:UDP-N-acetylglucosamine/UDP-N-acetylgalactosamine diphosphorylase
MMYGVTMGSLINFCDALLTGGLSRKVHTEVGSGFIHFNFTPWGETGDKATPSLIGTVTEGVFLDKPPIFLGGMSGIVGPKEIGFGAMTVAGQVVRRSVPDETMYSGERISFEKAFSYNNSIPSEKHVRQVRECNTMYLAQLYALKAWYTQVRLKRSRICDDEELSLVYAGALETLDECVKERVKRYKSFASRWDAKPLDDACLFENPPLLDISIDWKPELEYDKWIWSLSDCEKSLLHGWIVSCAEKIKNSL